MIHLIGFIIELIVSVISAAAFFLAETVRNFAVIKNFRRAIRRVKRDINRHKLDES